MKNINSATNVDMPSKYSTLDYNAYRAGYDMQYNNEEDITFTTTEENYPDIILLPEKDSDGTITFNVDVKFPELITEDSWYYDDVSYYVDKWYRKVCPFIEEILDFSYNRESDEEI